MRADQVPLTGQRLTHSHKGSRLEQSLWLLQGAMGMNTQQDDRVLAREIAQEVCMADMIEFQRLTEQFEEVREWLLT